MALLWCNVGFALTQQAAIEQYLSNRPLEDIEGIFEGSGPRRGNLYAIVKTSNGYRCIVIRHKTSSSGSSTCQLNRSLQGYFIVESNGSDIRVNVSVDIFNNVLNITAVENNQIVEWGRRIWPTDIDSHNANLGGNNLEMISMIDKAKDTCKSLGFTEGTDKFADCSLTLYSQSVELAAANNQQIVIQGQSSGSNVMTIYDPVRDNNALIKRGQGLINGTCTLGDLSTC